MMDDHLQDGHDHDDNASPLPPPPTEESLPKEIRDALEKSVRQLPRRRQKDKIVSSEMDLFEDDFADEVLDFSSDQLGSLSDEKSAKKVDRGLVSLNEALMQEDNNVVSDGHIGDLGGGKPLRKPHAPHKSGHQKPPLDEEDDLPRELKLLVRSDKRPGAFGQYIRQMRRGFIVIFAIAVICLTAFLIVSPIWSNTFYQGIKIDGLSIGGLTREQAKKVIVQLEQEKVAQLRINLRKDAKYWTLLAKDMSVQSDVSAVMDAAWQIGRTGSWVERFQAISQTKKGVLLDTHITINYNQLVAPLSQIKREVDTLPVDGHVLFSPNSAPMFRYIKEKDGYEMQVNEVLNLIRKQFSTTAPLSIEIPVHKIAPKHLVQDLQGVDHLLSSVTLPLQGASGARLSNIRLAASRCNGKIIGAGENISFNAWVGERMDGTGYKKVSALDFLPDAIDSPGGGSAQVACALYMASLKSELEVIQRVAPTWQPGYAPYGFGVKISDTADLLLRNTSRLPLFVKMTVNSTSITCSVYGTPFTTNRKYELSGILMSTIKPPAGVVRKQDTQKVVVQYQNETTTYPARSGLKVQALRIRISPDGSRFSEILHTETYAPQSAVELVGIDKKPTQ